MKYSIPRKRVLLGLSALAVCVVLALTILWFVKPRTTPPDAYVYRSEEGTFVVRADGTAVLLPHSEKLYDCRFSPDGKYLYYLCLDEHIHVEDAGNLYRVEYQKLTGDTDHDQTLVEHISERADWSTLILADDGNTVVYLDSERKLYAYQEQSATFIAANVSEAWVDGDRIAYIIERISHRDAILYKVSMHALDRSVKVLGDYSSLLAKDLDALLFTRPDSNGRTSLYRLGLFGEARKISSRMSSFLRSDSFGEAYGHYYLEHARTVERNGKSVKVYNLCRILNGRSHIVAADIVTYEATGVEGYIKYYTLRDYHENPSEMRRLEHGYMLDCRTERTIRYSSSAAETLNELGRARKLFIADKTFYAVVESENGFSLWTAPIRSGRIGKLKKVVEGLRNFGLYDGAFYYGKNKTAPSHPLTVYDWYVFRNGKSTRLIQDANKAYLYEDGSWIVRRRCRYEGWNIVYDLHFIDRDGNDILISDQVTAEWRISKDKILYMRDGKMYAFNGERSTLVAENAELICAQNLMPEAFFRKFV